MGILFYALFIIIILIYGGLNYYIGLRGYQTISYFLPFLNSKIYWPIFWFVAVSYILARFSSRFLPDIIDNIITRIGAYWMAALLYFTLLLIIFEFIRLLNRWTGFLPAWFKNNPAALPSIGLSSLLLVLFLLAYGTWNANSPKVKHYDLTINKNAGSNHELHAVMVSDIHLGVIVNNERLEKMVRMINEQNPDIILIAGDIIDEDVQPFVEQKMIDTLQKLKSKYGTFAIMGNHEYYGGHVDTITKHLQDAGIEVLRDRYIKVAESFYIIGREDLAIERMNKEKRKILSNVMEDIDKSYPIILLDHQPSHLEEPQKQGVDLQLSGHTHRGQMFPNHFITGRIFEVDWGYLAKDDFHIIVSSGLGTWGPPIRIGNSSEIVDITIRFANPKL